MIVGGHGELGTTPPWFAVERARTEMKLDRAAPTADRAADLARRAGASHIAAGELTGDTTLTLTYRLLRESDGTAVGAPITATGSREQIVAALPRMARELALHLGVTQPRVPALVGATPDELAAIGHAAWAYDTTAMPPDDLRVLLPLAQKQPLAAIEVMTVAEGRSAAGLEETGEALLKALPDNVLAWASVSAGYSPHLARHADAIDALRARFPKSYLCALSALSLARKQGSPEADALAQSMAALAPRSPDALVTFAAVIATRADMIRRARVASDLSADEWDALHRLYDARMAALQKATTLDPDHVKAWTRLANAATFAGREDVADAALWRALELEPRNQDALLWGLQMYQPKWLNRPDKLLKVANLAVAQGDVMVSDAAEALVAAGQTEQARDIVARGLANLRARVKQNPTDSYAKFALAWTLYRQKQFADGAAVAMELVRTDPGMGSGHLVAGLCLNGEGQYSAALPELREAMRVAQNNALAHLELGRALGECGQTTDARRELEQALRLAQDSGTAQAAKALLDGLGQ